MMNSISHFPKQTSNKYFEEQQKLNKRRVADLSSCEEDSENGQTAEPDPTLLQKLKEIMRTLQKNQKSLSYELNVSATTISAYFTAKRRSKGWASFERRLVQWIVSQNMDSALVENPDDEDLLQAVETCKEIQRSLREEDKNHIQPAPSAKVTPLNLAKIPTQQLPPLELPQTMPETRFESRERASSRQYFVADAEPQFQFRAQVVMPTQGRRNSWMCLTEMNSEPIAMEAADVQFESYYNAPYVNYNSDGKSDAVDYYGDMGFDLSFAKPQQSFSMPAQYDYVPQFYGY
jgi:hypothetical protein